MQDGNWKAVAETTGIAAIVASLIVGGLQMRQAPEMASEAPALEKARQQVRSAETAFAATMADLDIDAFGAFIADDALFFSGNEPLRGKEQVVATWSAFFAGDDAPFSWAPDTVEVFADGTLAYNSGPVRNPGGEVIGRFNSIWRNEGDGRWRVVFDKGSD